MLDKILQKLGLSSKEARVYLAALELGAAPVQQIAKKASVNRPTTYVILESLMKKGLATSVERGKKVLFTAEPPEQLERLLAWEQDVIEEKRQDLLKIMPELEAIFNLSENRPKVKFYEGKEGVRAANEDFMKDLVKGDTIDAFTPLDDMINTFPQFLKTQPEQRIQKKIKSRVIYTHKDGPIPRASNRKELREAHFLPRATFPLTGTLSIVKDKKIGIVVYRNNIVAVNIENPGIANMMEAIFELSWKDLNDK
jgi:sugar-specific transcriptional regulator TrmB